MKIKPDWRAIEKAAIAGMPYPLLAEKFGVSLAAVKKQASRGKWPVPARIMRRARELSPHVTGDAVTMAAENLLNDGQTASLHAMKILLGKLAKAAKHPETVDDIASVGEVVTAGKGARSIAGLDRVEPANVSVNLAAIFGTEIESQTIPARELRAIVLEP